MVIAHFLVLAAATFSIRSAAAATTSDLDVGTGISGYAANVTWADKSAIFGTSETTWEDTGRKVHTHQKSDFKRYRDGDRIECRAVVVVDYAGPRQTFNSTGEEKQLAVPGMAIYLSKMVGQPQATGQPSAFLNVNRTNPEIATVLNNLKCDQRCGQFLEGKVFDLRLAYTDLPTLFKTSRSRVTTRTETYHGQACCVLELKTDADRYAVWLAPVMDYTCIRFELSHNKIDHFSDSGGRYKSYETLCEISDVRQVEGKWIAMAGRMVTTTIRADGTSMKDSVSIQRQKVSVNPDFVELGAFQANDVPEGARVSFREANMAPGVQFEWHHGKIVAGIDDDSIRRVINDAAFAVPQEGESGTGTNAGLWAAALGLGAVIVALAAVAVVQKKNINKRKGASPVMR